MLPVNCDLATVQLRPCVESVTDVTAVVLENSLLLLLSREMKLGLPLLTFKPAAPLTLMARVLKNRVISVTLPSRSIRPRRPEVNARAQKRRAAGRKAAG